MNDYPGQFCYKHLNTNFIKMNFLFEYGQDNYYFSITTV